MKLSKLQTGVLALIIANTIWGAAPPIFKWSLFNVGPFTLAFLRFFIAALLILPFALHSIKIKKVDFSHIFFVSLSGVTINILAFFFGLRFAPSINATTIGSAGPVFLIFSAIFFLHEKPKTHTKIGAYLGLIGVSIILAKPLFVSHGDGLSFFGNILYFISMIAAVVQTLFARKLMKKYSASAVSFWSFFIGAVTFFPFFLLEVETKGFLANLTFQGIFGIMYGALFSSFIAYFLYYWALKYLPVSETGVFLYIDPIVTVLVAIPLLGEIPDGLFLFGSLLVFLGIFIAEGRLHYHPFHLLFKSNH